MHALDFNGGTQGAEKYACIRLDPIHKFEANRWMRLTDTNIPFFYTTPSMHRLDLKECMHLIG